MFFVSNLKSFAGHSLFYWKIEYKNASILLNHRK